MTRRIVLFVEGDTECGEARRKTLPVFFHKWLDPQLPRMSRVGIQAVKFQGVSEFLDELPKKVELYLDGGQANFIVGLVDLYGIPSHRIDLSPHATVEQKVAAARKYIKSLVPSRFRAYFHQHFAVHEVEAWLLAYPERWPPEVRDRIKKRPPEQVNFKEPPAKFLGRILGRRYKKTVYAGNLFPVVDPQTAIDKCPFLRLLAEDLLAIARHLQ
ncbi:MAG TPA: DUF4276 family protein [Thermoguttaceae bacterium]|nr:DUF4276 family protein [Thermoguttaceae bacterium]